MTLLEPSHLLIIHESYPAHLLTLFWLCHQQPKLKMNKNPHIIWIVHYSQKEIMVAMKMINISFPLSSPKLTMDMQEQEEDSSNFYSMKVTIESKLYVIRSNAWQQIYSYKIPVSSNIAWRNKIKRHKVTYKLQPAVVLLSKR